MPGNENVEAAALDHETLWRRMRQLLERTFTATGLEELLDEALDAVLDLLGADRGLVQLVEPSGEVHVIHARAPGRALSAWEREEVSKTILAEARTRGECVVWTPGNLPADADSLVSFGIETAIATPLHAVPWGGAPSPAARVCGVLYVDFRTAGREIGEAHREFVQIAAMYASTLVAQRAPLGRGVTPSSAPSRLAASEPAPTLDELLRPDSLAALRREIASCLPGGAPILITGESGTGKTLFARAIAETSGQTPVVRAMLGTSDDLNTVTSELFGHERGSFSGATGRRPGLVEFADGGTLILDEILNLHATAQQLLLDFTQFGTYRPLGHERGEPRRARVRLIAVTNGDLAAAVRAGRFREDLYYRLAGVRLHLPPLRARRQDVPALAESYLRRLDPARGWQLAVAARKLLLSQDLDWPGNVRQLETALLRARDRARLRDPDGTRILVEDLARGDLDGLGSVASVEPHAPRTPVGPPADDASLLDAWRALEAEKLRVQTLEKQLLRRLLAAHEGVAGTVARALGIGRTSLLSRLRTLGLDEPAPRGRRR